MANRYGTLIEKIFFDRYNDGATEIAFTRTDIEVAAGLWASSYQKIWAICSMPFGFGRSCPHALSRQSPKVWSG